MADFSLPWVDSLLTTIQEEYKKTPPTFEFVNPTKNDIQYIKTNASHEDQFDTLGLKADFSKRLATGQATLQKSRCDLGEILLVTFKEDTYRPPWKTWWRAIRLLSSKPARVVIFAHPQKRLSPSHGEPLAEAHVNGGMTMRCNAQSIVIYRKEEATRVLIHELFHASCSDPYYLSVPFLEADTEAWAELVLCGMAARGEAVQFKKYMTKQIKYAIKQETSAETYHGLSGPKDYAWRYLSGRLNVWRKLGILFDEKELESLYKDTEKVKSLRFTTCEPDNV